MNMGRVYRAWHQPAHCHDHLQRLSGKREASTAADRLIRSGRTSQENHNRMGMPRIEHISASNRIKLSSRHETWAIMDIDIPGSIGNTTYYIRDHRGHCRIP